MYNTTSLNGRIDNLRICSVETCEEGQHVYPDIMGSFYAELEEIVDRKALRYKQDDNRALIIVRWNGNFTCYLPEMILNGKQTKAFEESLWDDRKEALKDAISLWIEDGCPAQRPIASGETNYTFRPTHNYLKPAELKTHVTNQEKREAIEDEKYAALMGE